MKTKKSNNVVVQNKKQSKTKIFPKIHFIYIFFTGTNR